MANKRKCGYKPCSAMFRPESGNVGTVIYCSPECKILKFGTKPKAKVNAKRPKLKSIGQLVEACAVTLQRLVRVKTADSEGMVTCITCRKRLHWKEAQGGHLIERGKRATKLVEEAINPQCAYCNQWGMKQASVVLTYRKHMVDMYGEQFMRWLELEAHKIKKYTRAEIAEIHDGFKKRLRELEQEKGFT